MKIRLMGCGNKKIAVIKEVRAATGLNLKEAKQLCDRAPVELPPIQDEIRGAEVVRNLRDAGATVEAQCETTVLDKLTAASYIQTAATALGEGNIHDTRISLRAALRLLGDYGLDQITV